MNPKGRPVKSAIRDNIQILLEKNSGIGGYQIFKIYIKQYNPMPRITLRAIYYNLKKGEELGIFRMEVDKENLSHKYYLTKNVEVA